MSYKTADLIDAHGDSLQSCVTQFRQFGANRNFNGKIRTIQTLEDNALIKKVLAESNPGAVLIVHGGGSLNTALMGDVVAASALKNGWSGMIIYGAVRDTVELASLSLGIKALGSNPRKSTKNGTGKVDVPVTFGGVIFAPGNWVYSDEDGLVVSSSRLPL